MILFQHVNNLCFGSSKENLIRFINDKKQFIMKRENVDIEVACKEKSNRYSQHLKWAIFFLGKKRLQKKIICKKKVPTIFLLFGEVTFKLISCSPRLL